MHGTGLHASAGLDVGSWGYGRSGVRVEGGVEAGVSCAGG